MSRKIFLPDPYPPRVARALLDVGHRLTPEGQGAFEPCSDVVVTAPFSPSAFFYVGAALASSLRVWVLREASVAPTDGEASAFVERNAAGVVSSIGELVARLAESPPAP